MKKFKLVYSFVAIVSLLMISLSGVAQQKRITGTVVDATTNNPLFGATVSVQNSETTTVTARDGKFAVAVPNGNATLVVSFVSFETLEVPLNGRSQVSVALQPAAAGLQEIVIGYGTQRKEDLTGSVSSAPIEAMQKAPVGSFAESLGGRVAGVTFSSADAQPGSGTNIVIRGNNSITQSNSPLYVVDGFPIEGPNQNTINPNDIKSIEVLKDASATAIYGSLGGGGNLLLNVGPKGTGEFPPQAVERLKAIGDWMKINGESINDTKPWKVTSEQVSDLTLSNAVVHDALGDVTSKVILPDIYFTSKGNTVYVIARSWKDASLSVKSLATNKHSIASVKMPGSKSKIK